MGLMELFLIAVGLSMDAFAVAVCKGLGMKKLDLRRAGLVALFFGGFQGLMPLIGWILGSQFEQYIVSIDHWIAFLLLGYIGGKMIWDAFHDDGECECCDNFSINELFIMAVATSFIGSITFILSFLGVFIGFKFGSKFKSKATLAGGVILCLIGAKILLEHLGILVL